MTEVAKHQSAFDYFASTQETLSDAEKKHSQEFSSEKTTYLKLDKDGTYAVRILPIAPTIVNGVPVAPDRKGYEYPVRDTLLKIANPSDPSKYKYAYVPHIQQSIPHAPSDLIDTYLKQTLADNASDKELCDKVNSNSYGGGLKWNVNRVMYVIDLNEPAKGLQLLKLTFSQYKALEEAKLAFWKKLKERQGECACPISSVNNGYRVDITRKTSGAKTEYKFAIDVLEGIVPIAEKTLNDLLAAPRLNEVLYRYNRYMLEATIAFLEQYDATMGISTMKSESVQECIEQIKALLPADDQSHFSFEEKKKDKQDASPVSIDDLWAELESLEQNGEDDRSEGGRSLRAKIGEFVESNDLDVSISRRKTTRALLEEIDHVLSTTPES